MIKLIHSGSQDELLRAAGGVMSTLIDDKKHIKSASSSAFTEKFIRDNYPDSDAKFGSHLIAMGSSEQYGWNKNGDWWPEQELIDRHDTFKKHGHYFREHNNRDPKLAIGEVKASAFNKDMHRVELIIWGDKVKAAAEYERAKSGKQSSYSMSARVKLDICSCCGNEAKTSKNYCGHLKQAMGQYIPKFKKFAYAFNVRPTFFDISDVANPADRIAHHLQYMFSDGDELAKSASAEFPFSDMLAERAGVMLPDDMDTVLGCMDRGSMKALEKLAAAESYLRAISTQPDNVAKDEKFHFVKNAAPNAFDYTSLTDADLKTLRSVEPDVLFHHMAKASAALPFLEFFAYATNKSIKQAMADPAYTYAEKHLLDNIFSDIQTSPADNDLEEMFKASSSFKAGMILLDRNVQQVISKIAEQHSMKAASVRSRVLRGCATNPAPCGEGIKEASTECEAVVSMAKTVAKSYGLYKIALCRSVADMCCEDSVDAHISLLVALQHSKLK